MKFTIRNLEPYSRSIPTLGNIGHEIPAGGTITVDYPKSFEPFFNSLRKNNYHVTSEPSELDDKLSKHEELMKSYTLGKKSDKADDTKVIKKLIELAFTNTTYNVEFATDIAKVGLPKKLSGKFSDNTEAKVNIVWDAKNYKGNQEGTYMVSGSPININNPDNISVTAKIIVSAPPKVDEPVPEPVVESQNSSEESTTEVEQPKIESTLSIEDQLRKLNSEQLKAICNKLSIFTSSNKVNTLVSKILNSGVVEADIVKAINDVTK